MEGPEQLTVRHRLIRMASLVGMLAGWESLCGDACGWLRSGM
jgi:hypothetical protein